MEVTINYLAVAVCALASMALGFLWYGPLFGKPWIAMSGITPGSMGQPKAGSMPMTYVISFVGSIVMAITLAHSLVFASTYLNISGVSAGLQAGFWNWLGFIAPVTLGSVLWEGKPWKLWMLNSAYYLVLLMVMGTVLSFWR